MEYASLREKIAAESKARKARYGEFEAAYAKAYAAGKAAGEAALPTPMVVSEHVNPLDDNSAVKRAWYVSEGACGFAWVTVAPGTSSFAKWLVKGKRARKAYRGGVEIWIGEFGQSVDRKSAMAGKMAEVLREELGIEAYAGSRLD